MIKPITRRMRCSYQSCKNLASYGLGSKGIDYPLCDEHFKLLIEDGYNILNPVAEPVVEEVVEEVIEEVPVVEETPVPVEEKKNPDDYFVCKYCGEMFLKKETSVAQFAAHVKKCKKEHEQ